MTPYEVCLLNSTYRNIIMENFESISYRRERERESYMLGGFALFTETALYCFYVFSTQGPMGMRGDSGPAGPAGKAGLPVSSLFSLSRNQKYMLLKL